jgi:hypothetical protein
VSVVNLNKLSFLVTIMSKQQQSKKKKNQKQRPNQNRQVPNGTTKYHPEMVMYRNPRGIPFPQRYRTNFRCSILGNIVAASSPTVYLCSTNSLYLPFAGGGWPGVNVASIATLQPCGFSNLIGSNGPYNNYRVTGSSIRVRIIPASAADMITYTVTPGNQGSAPTTVSDALAEPRTKSQRASAGGSLTEINHAMNVASFLGVNSQAISNDLVGLFSGSYNSGPTQHPYWYVAWTTSNGGTVGGALSYEIELIFEAELFNLNNGALLDN